MLDYHPSHPNLRSFIKHAILLDETISIDELRSLVAQWGPPPTRLTIASIRQTFREDLRFLRAVGSLGEIDRNRIPPLPQPPHLPSGLSKPGGKEPRFYYDE